MASRVVPVVLIGLLVVLHAQLWFGRGSLPDVSQLSQRLAVQRAANDQSRLTNERLAAEVRDLQEGLEMVEEKARLELGMVKPNEVFVQIVR